MSELNSLEGFRDRFWYWRGKSGTRYIHSIYAPDNCPPLPGAIFIMVQKLANGKRAALEVGRFCQDWDYVAGVIDDHRVGFSKVDEIHVHLLAQSNDNADEVVRDLVAGIGPRPVPVRPTLADKGFGGFREEKTSLLAPVAAPVSRELAAKTRTQVPNWQMGLFDDQGVANLSSSASSSVSASI